MSKLVDSWIIIGRARDIDESILNTLISRNHCRITYIGNNEWMVTNLSSTVTLLNDKLIPRGQSHKIGVGDTLQLSEVDDFKYLFTLNIKCDKNVKRSCSNQTAIDNEVERQKTQFVKNQASEKKDLEDKLLIEKQKQTELQEQLEILLKRQQDSEKDDEKLKEQISSLENKIECGNVAEKELKLKYEQLVTKLEEEKRKFEEKMSEEKRKWNEALESTRKEKESLEATWKAKEAEWQSMINNAVKEEQNIREKLLNEKLELEEKMKKLEEKIEEKEKREQAVLRSFQGTSIDLENNCIVFEVKNNSDIEIFDTIDLSGDVVEVVSTQSSTNDATAFDLVNSIMEEQLTCSICSELFVSAMTLNCTHTFCQYCILLWMKKSKNCPNCRSKIISMNKSIVLDNFIEEMVKNISIEQKQRRINLIEQRSKQVPKLQMKTCKRR